MRGDGTARGIVQEEQCPCQVLDRHEVDLIHCGYLEKRQCFHGQASARGMSEASVDKSVFRVLRTVGSAFFGVRRKSDSDRDLEHLTIKQIVLAAVLVMVFFVTTLLVVVKTILG